jgi:hypothetical protein
MALRRAEERAIAALSKWGEDAKFINLAKENAERKAKRTSKTVMRNARFPPRSATAPLVQRSNCGAFPASSDLTTDAQANQ